MSSILVRSWALGALALAVAVGGCRAPEERAAKFAGMYEAALAGNDPWTARIAMQRAVQYDDANPRYWASLAQVQVRLEDYSGAYNSYLRASELDRSNPMILQSLADLAALSGLTEESRRYANQVLLLRPSDLAPQATLGFVALRDHDYEQALKRADTVLEARPGDSNATTLKARALASLDRADEALRLLEAHVAREPRDEAALNTLAAIAGRFGNLRGQETAQARLLELRPKDEALRVAYAGTLYQLGERERPHAMTLEMARTGQHGGQLIEILGMWLRHEPRARALEEVRSLLADAGPADRFRYAYFLMLAGEPAEAEGILAQLAAPPVTAANASALALLAQSRAMQGRHAEALPLLDQVITFDSSNVVALRARTDLYLRTGRGRPAIFDAQKLVAEKPRSADDRVRLARAYQMEGKRQLAENTLRAGIEEVPGDPLLYENLKRFLIAAGRRDELADLDQRYLEQKRLARAQW